MMPGEPPDAAKTPKGLHSQSVVHVSFALAEQHMSFSQPSELLKAVGTVVKVRRTATACLRGGVPLS
jgi:hypothetical protein